MKDIKELATLTAAEMDDVHLRNVPASILEQYCTRLIAAYVEGQEPFIVTQWDPMTEPSGGVWLDGRDKRHFFPYGTKLFTAPSEPQQTDEKGRAMTYWGGLENKKGAAPSSEEVREMMEKLKNAGAYWSISGTWATDAADFIERLAARVPPDCVVVPREPTEEILRAMNRHRCLCETSWSNIERTEKPLYTAMIAAGEVKP